MKKTLLLSALILIGIVVSSNAQNCTPAGTGSTPQSFTLLPASLPNATVNTPYQQAITIGIPTSFSVLPINWVKMNHIESKLGNNWTIVNSTGGTTFPQWSGGTWQCITLIGTPVNSGTDSIIAYIDGNSITGDLPNINMGSIPLVISTPQSVTSQTMENQVSITPNPSNGNYTITVGAQYNMSILDFTGRTVLTKTISEGSTALDLTNQNSGIYFVRLTSNTESKTLRIIKK